MEQIDINKFAQFCKKNYSCYQHSNDYILKDFQKQIILDLYTNDNIIIGKSRQMGISSLFQLYVSYLLLHEKSIYITISGHNRDNSRRFIDACREIIDNVHLKTKPVYNINNRSTIKILNNCLSIEILNSPRAYDFNNYKFKIFISDESVFDIKLNEKLNYAREYYNKFILYSSNTNMSSLFNSIWINHDNLYSDWHRIVCLYNLLNNKQTIQYKTDNIYGWYSIEPNENDSEYIKQMKQIINPESFDFEMCFKHLLDVKPVEKNKTKNLNIRIPDELHLKVMQKVTQKNITLSDYIRKLIENDIS
jgi:predicted DNA binding CopG/RHH family protein